MQRRERYFVSSVLLVCLMCFLWTASGKAQISRANLNGTVTDPSGASVPNAKVAVLKVDTGLTRQMSTGASGVYSLSSLPVGKYNLTISREGFRTYVETGIELFVGQTRTVDVQLQVGAATTRVEVRGQAQAVDASNAEIAGIVQSKQVEEIPLNGRNWSTLAMLAPGVVNLGGGGQRDLRFVGRGKDDNNYTFDGLDATGVQEQSQKVGARLPISLDSIAEFRVASSVYTADKGGSAGAQVSVVTKSGTNVFHGAAFEFLRNNAVDARGPFDYNPLTGLGYVPPLRLNQFGGEIGGPIKKDRTFFYASYEGIRQVQDITVIGFVPNAAYRASVAATSPALAPFLASWPVGQTHVDSLTDQWTSPGANDQREDNGMFRLDHTFSNKTSIFGRAIVDDATISSPGDTVGGRDNPHVRPSNYVIQLTHTFSPTVVNELRGGVNRSALHHYFYGTSPFLTNTVDGPAYVAVNVSGFDSPNQNSLDEEIGTTLDVYDDLSIVKGRHTIKIGMGVERHRLNNSSEAQWNDTTLTYASPQDFVNNVLSEYDFIGELTLGGHRRTYFMPYVQDTFKVRPNLTLYYGLRYEYYTVLKEVHGRQAVVTIACGGVCPKGTPLYGPTYRNFAPRLGLAWQPGGGKTVLRAGFGMYYEPNQMDDFSDGHESTGQRVDVSSADVPNLTWPLTPAQLTAPFFSPKAWDPKRRDGYFEDWEFSVQRMLPHSFLGQIAYQGSQGHHLFSAVLFNRCEGNSGLTAGACIRPIPTFGEFEQKGNNGNSNFNSLQVSVERPLTTGWLWGTQYMWAHALADNGFGAGEHPDIQNYSCIKCSYGDSDIDIRQTLSVNSVYELPFGPGKRFLQAHGVAGKLVGGWELSGIGSASTGRPINILVDVSPTDRPDGVAENQRPDLVPGQSIYGSPKTINNWFNLNAFAVPAVGTWGSLAHNAGRGPGYYEIDTALEKSTALTERLSLKFRAEAFNLFNHPIYGDPAPDISNPSSFGVITSELNTNPTGLGSSRKIQFMLRLEF